MDDRWETLGPPTLTNFLLFLGKDSKCYLKALNELLFSWTALQYSKGRTNLNRFTTCWLFPGRSGKSLWHGSMYMSEQVSANENTLPVYVYNKKNLHKSLLSCYVWHMLFNVYVTSTSYSAVTSMISKKNLFLRKKYIFRTYKGCLYRVSKLPVL